MLVNNITALYIIPLVFCLLGVFFTIRGMRINNFIGIRNSLYFYIFAFFGFVFIDVLAGANAITFSSSMITVLTYIGWIMGVISISGIAFFHFNNFLPDIFVKTSVILAATSILIGSVAIYSEYDAIDSRTINFGKFKEVKEAPAKP